MAEAAASPTIGANAGGGAASLPLIGVAGQLVGALPVGLGVIPAGVAARVAMQVLGHSQITLTLGT